jgi:hypothetical protein
MNASRERGMVIPFAYTRAPCPPSLCRRAQQQPSVTVHNTATTFARVVCCSVATSVPEAQSWSLKRRGRFSVSLRKRPMVASLCYRDTITDALWALQTTRLAGAASVTQSRTLDIAHGLYAVPGTHSVEFRTVPLGGMCVTLELVVLLPASGEQGAANLRPRAIKRQRTCTTSMRRRWANTRWQAARASGRHPLAQQVLTA